MHFIRFPTSEMKNFLELAKKKGMASSVSTVCATGGGAFKFEENFKNVRFIKCIELKFLRLFVYMFSFGIVGITIFTRRIIVLKFNIRQQFFKKVFIILFLKTCVEVRRAFFLLMFFFSILKKKKVI